MPDSPYPLPPSRGQQARFVKAALASEGVNCPAEALAAIAPYIAEPVENLITVEGGRERLKPDRLSDLASDIGTAKVLTVRLSGCAGSVWEYNERQSTSWMSAADPAASASDAVLPLLTAYASNDERQTAALCAEVEDLAHVARLIARSASELSNREGKRGYDLAADLALNGQINPCLLVPQLYRSPKGAWWAWPAVKGNNRTKARHTLLGADPVALVTAPDVSEWLTAWATERNAELTETPNNADSSAQRAMLIAAVSTHLVVGSPTPDRLYWIVQGSNIREHLRPQLPWDISNLYRGIGRNVLAEYAAQGLLDLVTSDVLSGMRPISDMPGCPAEVSISFLRDLRSRMLMAEFFPSPVNEPRRKILRSALLAPAVPEEPESAGKVSYIDHRLRAWSALTSVSFTDSWNPRIVDGLVTTAVAKAGITIGAPLGELLSHAESDLDARSELFWYRAPHLLAAYDLIDADRGSKEGQTVKGGQETRKRRTIVNVVHALNKKPGQAVGLLREIVSAMDEGRRPRCVGVDGTPDTDGSLADQPWFDRTFPKNEVQAFARPAVSDGRGNMAHTVLSKPEPVVTRAKIHPTPPKVKSEQLKAAVRARLDEIEEKSKTLNGLITDVFDHSRTAGVADPWEEVEAVNLIAQAENIGREVREALDRVLPPGAERPVWEA